MEGINVDRSQTLAHVFHFFYAAGKACLVPFMTLFFRYIGLTAFQTGFIIGCQCILAVIVGPFWMMCMNRCGRQRFILMFSILICIASAILMSFVPAALDIRLVNQCSNKSFMTSEENSTGVISNQASLMNNTIENYSTAAYVPIVNTTNSTSTTSTLPPIKKTTTISTTTIKHSTSPHSKSTNWDQLSLEMQEFIKGLGYDENYVNQQSSEEFEEIKANMETLLKKSKKTTTPNKHSHKTTHQTHSPQKATTHGQRSKRDLIASALETFNEKLASWQIVTGQYKMFAMVLIIILLTELLSAPIETLADSLWFEFLDGLDFLERYGSQRVWSTLGLFIFPLCVTSIVDRTPCQLSSGIHHFLLHFYIYAGTLFVAFILSCCYPVFSDRKKIHRRGNIFKGCQVLCIDVHAACYVFTIILFGIASALYDIFLFWEVDEMGGTELYMGGAISLAAVSEFFMYPLSRLMIRKISNAGCLVLALFVFAIRLVLYSFMWAPWAVLIAALFHGLSHTLLWTCMETYQDFKVNPLIMDRSARTLLQSIHKMVGYGGGSILSGYLYKTFGWSTMLQAAAIGLLLWSILFSILQRCLPHKQKVRYAKLLQAEEDQDSDEEESVYDGDWLEIALKNEK